MKTTDVTITLTAEQYRDLLTLTYLGDEVAHLQPRETTSRQTLERYKALYATLADYDAPSGLSGYFIYDEKYPEGYPTQTYAQKVCDMIGHYKEDIFWEQLVERLAKRDALLELNLAEPPSLYADSAAEWKRWSAVINKYQTEYSAQFKTSGITQLFTHAAQSTPRKVPYHYH